MKAALIVMTILGCDDSVTQCHYISTVNQSWLTVAACDSQSERQIARHQNANYPVVVAVCESNGNKVTAELDEAPETTTALPTPDKGTTPTPPEDTAEERRGLAARTLAAVRKAVPHGESLKAAINTPVRYAEDGYSWVVRKFRD